MSDFAIASTHSMGDIVEIRFSVKLAGEAAPGLCFVPEGEASRPLVVIQHPGTSSKEDYFVRDVGMMWARSGWACMGLDAPGHGERAAHDPMGVLRNADRFAAATAQFAQELSEAVSAIQREYPIDPARLGYVGYSMGSMMGIPAVAGDGRYKAAAFCLAGEGGMVGVAADPASPVQQLGSVAVRIVGKLQDELFSRESTQGLFDALPCPDKDLVWLAGGHYEIGPDVIEAAREWLREKL